MPTIRHQFNMVFDESTERAILAYAGDRDPVTVLREIVVRDAALQDVAAGLGLTLSAMPGRRGGKRAGAGRRPKQRPDGG